MPGAPTCRCEVEVDMHRGKGRVILCPMHRATEDLYEALEALVDLMDIEAIHKDWPAAWEPIRNARTALAKARGESPDAK